MRANRSGRVAWLAVAALVAAFGLVARERRKDPGTVPVPARVIVESPDGGTLDVGKPVPAGALLGERFRFLVAIYHLPRPKTDPGRALDRVLAGKPIRCSAGPDEPSTGSASVWLDTPPVAEHPPPDAESLTYFGRGLSEKQKQQLTATRAVTTLTFTGPGRDALAVYPHALAVTRELAAATDGLIWDDETRELFARDAWSARSAGAEGALPDLVHQIVLHSYRDGDLIRIITLGMVKFALPDVVVDQVSGSASRSMATTVDLVCETLLERPSLATAGKLGVSLDGIKHAGFRKWAASNIYGNARRTAELELGRAELQEGDADNRLIAILFPGPEAGLQMRQSRTLDQIFGSADHLDRVEHDEALLAASARARATALKLKAHFVDGPPFGEQLLVKAPFKTPEGGNEWMWVEVVRWKGPVITGLLDNDPAEVPGLHAGARVEVQQDAIFDYLLTKRDGSEEGNETGKLIERAARGRKP